MNTRPYFVGHDDETKAAQAGIARESVGGIEDDRLLVPPQEKVGDPEGETVEDNDIATPPRAMS